MKYCPLQSGGIVALLADFLSGSSKTHSKHLWHPVIAVVLGDIWVFAANIYGTLLSLYL